VEFGSNKRGDLFLTINVEIPSKLSAEERKLYERLRLLEQKRPRS
jgi:DnaJ-class molecular chaperone